MSATKLYRVGNWAFRRKIPLVPLVCKGFIRLLFNCAIDPSTPIGPGSFFAYGGIGVVIHKRAVIGSNVSIAQGVTVGGKSGAYEVPVIGDDVSIGAGAKVLGPITVGKGSAIGANAVVIRDVPANCVVAGVPARIIRSDRI